MIFLALILVAIVVSTRDHGEAHRFDESTAPLAPRSRAPRDGPTIRQIRENDLPRVIDPDGTVRTIVQDKDGNWS